MRMTGAMRPWIIGCMDGSRILISNELESYRQVLAHAFRELRPDLEVFEAEPGDLDRKVLRVRPIFVVCSHVTTTVKRHVPNWVELYAGHGELSMVRVGGEPFAVDDMQLPRLISLLDEAERLSSQTG